MVSSLARAVHSAASGEVDGFVVSTMFCAQQTPARAERMLSSEEITGAAVTVEAMRADERMESFILDDN